MATKTILQSFLKKAKPKRLLVLCHANADVDAMASSIALYFSLPKKIKVTVGVPEHANQSAQQLAKKLGGKFTLNPFLESFDAIILVDFNEKHRAGKLEKELLSFSKPILILDHHQKTKQSIPTKFARLEPKAPSAAFMVLQELEHLRFSPSKKTLLALAAGMVSDSSDLLVADGVLLEKISFCLQKTGFSLQEVRALYDIPVNVSEKIAKLKSLHRLRLFEVNGFLVALSNTNFFEAQSAMALLASGADIAFVAGIEKGSELCRLIGRVSLPCLQKTKLHLARDVCTKLPRSFGGHGNGHAGAAGFSAFHAQPEFVLQQSLDLITDFFRQKNKSLEFREII
ncbi:DHH family phosphoesterase [Candidatus Micrarchaeota archaeon]|nr:DHH family phosphoesterase [Candidatus Micrarchaeota archaeon]MBU1930331.1 DHH family phosphoesterase [Candidatus Micrarchaeota archaeon]